MIVTFYSFKGGVGRTLAWPTSVSFLRRTAIGYLPLTSISRLPASPDTWRTSSAENCNSNAAYRVAGKAARRRRRGGIVTAESRRSAAPGRRRRSRPDHKRLSEQGLSGENSGFNWASFFREADGGDFFEQCRHQWSQQYDFVLIDSRTGITDSGGICTIQLPDLIVPVFTASRQSVEALSMSCCGRRKSDSCSPMTGHRPPSFHWRQGSIHAPSTRCLSSGWTSSRRNSASSIRHGYRRTYRSSESLKGRSCHTSHFSVSARDCRFSRKPAQTGVTELCFTHLRAPLGEQPEGRAHHPHLRGRRCSRRGSQAGAGGVP